jgi:hypothetical protein
MGLQDKCINPFPSIIKSKESVDQEKINKLMTFSYRNSVFCSGNEKENQRKNEVKRARFEIDEISVKASKSEKILPQQKPTIDSKEVAKEVLDLCNVTEKKNQSSSKSLKKGEGKLISSYMANTSEVYNRLKESMTANRKAPKKNMFLS